MRLKYTISLLSVTRCRAIVAVPGNRLEGNGMYIVVVFFGFLLYFLVLRESGLSTWVIVAILVPISVLASWLKGIGDRKKQAERDSRAQRILDES